MSDLWQDINPGSDSSDDRSSDERIKYQYNPDDQEQEKVVSVPCRNPRILRCGDQRALQLYKVILKNQKISCFSSIT